MDSRNLSALASAFKAVVGKTRKIKELKITHDMSDTKVNNLIKKLSVAKAEAGEGDEWTDHIKGQRWYVESLVAFDAMTASERLDFEYTNMFPQIASESEMLAELEKLINEA